MLGELLFYVALFLILLGFSAFFSGSETAYFSLTPAQLNNFRNSVNKAERQVGFLMSTPRQLLISIVVGNTVVNITIASLAALLTLRFSLLFQLDQNITIL
ncbi:MAG: DUF21 domain-containing protein, partial [Calditrichaeota bacterium]